MTKFQILPACLVMVTLFACGESGDESVVMSLPDMTRQLGDQYVPPLNDGGIDTADAMPLADMRLPTPVTDCSSLCERLRACSSGLLGASDTCEETCAELTNYDGYDAFLACADGAECSALNSCRVPEPPPPTCEEVCGALDTCEPATRLPQALADVDTCTDACTEPARAEAIGVCGRSIAEGISACDGDIFSRCLAERLYPVCSAVCDRKLECGVASDYIDCLVSCATPSSETDPVTRRRARLRQTCWQTAAECAEAIQCDEPATPAQYDATALCAADEACSSQIDAPCVDTVSALSMSIDHETLDCVAESLTQTCDESLADCFTQASLDPLECDEYCAIAMLCEQLPENQSEFDCSTNCRAAVGGSPEEVARFRRPTSCAYVNTCDELTLCLEQSGGADLCDSACTHLAGCENPDSNDIDLNTCTAQCNASSTLREEVYFTCNAMIDACLTPQQCAVPPAPNCATICDGLQGCGLSEPRCMQTCDDNAYLEPDAFIETYACHAVARNCPEHERCQQGDRSAGRACIQHCRGQLNCVGDQSAMLACIDECASGLAGQAGVNFESNYTCLQALPVEASCEAIDDCSMMTTPESVCDAVCAARSRCVLLEGEQTLEACRDECVGNLATTPDAYACALRAGRVTNGCIDLAACLDIDVPAAEPACVTQCQARAQCDESVDQFLCERQCDSAAMGTEIRLSCLAQHSECDNVLGCLDNPVEDPSICAGICTTLEQCDGQIGSGGRYEDAAVCQTDCGIEALIDANADHPALSACLDEAVCVDEDIERCFNGGASAPTCDNAWTAYEECGNDSNFLWAFVTPPVTDRASYLSFCMGLIASDGAAAIEPKLACVINAAATGMCDAQIACAF